MAAVVAPNTTTQLSHAVTIRANGKTIGAISEWNPRQTRTVTELYELGVVTSGGGPDGLPYQYSKLSGEPFEKVPGNVSGMQVDVRRYDLYTEQMETAFGAAGQSALHLLSNQTSPFNVYETWTKPTNTNNYYAFYQGCWFSDLGRTISATGDRIVNVNATLQYTRRDLIPI